MEKTPFTIAAERAKENGSNALAARMTTEGKIARKIIEAILGAGMTVGVNDGEETVLKHSTSLNDALQALYSTDEDYIFAYDAETRKRVGTVFLVYGNDGYDVVNDYSTSLEEIMAPVNDYAESLCTA